MERGRLVHRVGGRRAVGTRCGFEASSGGTLLRESGVLPDLVHTSVLTRAIQTANLALDAAGLLWLPVRRSWRLNERHYGALQGKNKAQTREEFGEEQFMLWRRSYACRRHRWPTTTRTHRWATAVRPPPAGADAPHRVPQGRADPADAVLA